ncbi:ABC transporter permease [Nocardioides sp. NPDC006273]|uniref:ABC transporter permease n=1 Tax=Nocardioides sp. NPDC006273 TaxID=3155598 RepID=UPI0033B7D0AE
MTIDLALGRRRIMFRRLARTSPVVLVAAVVIGLVVLAAVLAPVLAPHDPHAVDLLNPYAGPGADHLLGTDASGRDLLSRLLYGARLSLAGPTVVIMLSMTVGTVIALVAAWCGGMVDAVISRCIEILFAFPGLVLAVVSVAVFGAGFWAPVMALSIGYVPLVARVLRSVALRERNLPYVAALQIQGVTPIRIALRHLLPNLMPMIIVQAGIGFAYAMLDLAAVSYLGLGLQPPTSDWGVMVSEGQASIIEGFPQQSLFAALVVLVTVVSMNVLCGWFAERYDVTGAQL